MRFGEWLATHIPDEGLVAKSWAVKTCTLSQDPVALCSVPVTNTGHLLMPY